MQQRDSRRSDVTKVADGDLDQLHAIRRDFVPGQVAVGAA
jgi:hypothetical protein